MAGIIKKNEFKVRVYDEETLCNLYALLSTNFFENMNDVMGRCLQVGSEQLLIKYGKAGALKAPESESVASTRMLDLLDRLTALELTVDDIFVMMNVVETLNSTIYNIQLAQLKNESLATELIETGFYGSLPEYVANVKERIVHRMEKGKGKKKHV